MPVLTKIQTHFLFCAGMASTADCILEKSPWPKGSTVIWQGAGFCPGITNQLLATFADPKWQQAKTRIHKQVENWRKDIFMATQEKEIEKYRNCVQVSWNILEANVAILVKFIMVIWLIKILKVVWKSPMIGHIIYKGYISSNPPFVKPSSNLKCFKNTDLTTFSMI